MKIWNNMEINFGVNKDNADKLIPMIISCMRLWFPEWKFPMKVGLDIGNRWGMTVGFTYNEISHIPIEDNDINNPNVVRYRQLTQEEQDKYQMYGPSSYVKDPNGTFKDNPDYLKVQEPNGEELTENDYKPKEEKKEEIKIEEPVSEIVEEKLFDNLMEEI